METLNLFLGSASAPSGSTWNAAIAALVSTGLPIFVILLLGQRATSAFYRGWRPGEGAPKTRRFRISKIWLGFFLLINALIFASACLLIFDKRIIPALVVLVSFVTAVWLGSTILVVLLFKSFIEVGTDAIVYRFGLKMRRTELRAVKGAYAASFLLIIELKEGGIVPLPLICIENVSDLATCLYEHLHKS